MSTRWKITNLAMPPDGLFQNHGACSSADSAWQRLGFRNVVGEELRRGLCYLLLVSHALPTTMLRPSARPRHRAFHVCVLPPCCGTRGEITARLSLQSSMSDFERGESLT